MEAWTENNCLVDDLLPEDQYVVDEFLEIGKLVNTIVFNSQRGIYTSN